MRCVNCAQCASFVGMDVLIDCYRSLFGKRASQNIFLQLAASRPGCSAQCVDSMTGVGWHGARRMWRVAWRAVRAVSLLVFPRGCAGCDVPDEVLCPQCTRLFREYPVRRVSACVESGEAWACAWYRGAARQAVLRWKDHGDEEADAPLCEALRALVRFRTAELRGLMKDLQRELLEDTPGGDAPGGDAPERATTEQEIQGGFPQEGEMRFPILVVPAPSSRASKRARGRFQTRTLALAVAQELRQCVGDAEYADVLDLQGVAAKSVASSNKAGRASRIRGHVCIKPRNRAVLRDRMVVLVDDIVTSGATLHECASVLHRHGARVVAAVALAVVPPRSDR